MRAKIIQGKKKLEFLHRANLQTKNMKMISHLLNYTKMQIDLQLTIKMLRNKTTLFNNQTIEIQF